MKKNLLKKSLALVLTFVGLLCTVNVVAATAEQSLIDVKVTVVDQTNVPVIGATVILVENNAKAVSTNVDGIAQIGNVPADGHLLIKYIGYNDQTVAINREREITVTLEENAELIDEVVVVGYGTQKKSSLTGSVAILDGEALESRPVANVTQALQGQVPGLNITSSGTSSEVGGTMDISIRGAGTIGTGSDASPLVIIDGVPGDLNTLNPNDIESFSILKDASASAIYGSRAAFGVIMVTTKSGKSGKVTINYSGNIRFSSPINLAEQVDSYTFAQVFNEASYTNDGGAISYNQTAMNNILAYQQGLITTETTASSDSSYWNSLFDANANNSWSSIHYADMQPSQEYNLSITGGNEKVNYRISGNLLDQNGILRYADDSFKRYTVNARLGAQLTEWLSVDFNTKWTREEISKPTYLNAQGNLFYHNISRWIPTAPLYDNYGNYHQDSYVIQLQDGGDYTTQKDILTNQISFTAVPLDGWRIVAEASYRTQTFFSRSEILPVSYIAPNGTVTYFDSGMGVSAGESKVTENANTSNYFNSNIYSDYTTSWGDHNFKAMAGFNAESYFYRSLWGSMQGLITPELPTLNTATSTPLTGGGYNQWSNAGFFGRLNYDYKEKYLVEFAARYDGSSRFIGDGRWGFFPSVSLGWNIAREDFMQSINHILPLLKLRASWGQLGNMNTSSYYPFYQTMPTGTSNGYWITDGSLNNTAYAPSMVTSALTWETVETYNVGFDFALLNHKLTGSIDYFERYTLGMVGPAPSLPSTLGTSVPSVNNTDMVSRGFELELSWRDKIGDFSYGIRAVLSDAVQTVLSYPNETGSLANTYYDGYKVGEIWGYTTVGIATSQTEMDAHLANNNPSWGSNWGEGDVMYADLNGDNVVNNGQNTIYDSGDMTVIGNSTPRYNYGITVDMQYKGFDFSMFWQGVGKRDFALDGQYMWGITGAYWQSTFYTAHMDYYRTSDNPLGENLDAYFPQVSFTKASQNHVVQTRYLQDASYIRLKNIQLGYTLPQSAMKALGLTNIRVYVSADNVLTFTNLMEGVDPEALSEAGWYGGTVKQYPLTLTLSAGVNITF